MVRPSSAWLTNSPARDPSCERLNCRSCMSAVLGRGDLLRGESIARRFGDLVFKRGFHLVDVFGLGRSDGGKRTVLLLRAGAEGAVHAVTQAFLFADADPQLALLVAAHDAVGQNHGRVVRILLIHVDRESPRRNTRWLCRAPRAMSSTGVELLPLPLDHRIRLGTLPGAEQLLRHLPDFGGDRNPRPPPARRSMRRRNPRRTSWLLRA